MKIRAAVILVGFAIGFVLPAFTQKRGSQSLSLWRHCREPQIVQQLEAINLKFDEAFNKHDAAAVGALYIVNAVQVSYSGYAGKDRVYGHV